MRTLSEVEQLFPGAAENGLSAADVAGSTRQFGANRLTPLPREPLWKKFVEKFDEPIIKILLAAALLSMFVDLFQGNPIAAGVALGVVAIALIGAMAMSWHEWVPTLLFGSGRVLFF